MAQVKYRNMFVQVILIIVTFGLYAFYWFYQTATELKAVTKDVEASPTLWTVLLFVPFANIYSYYMFAELYERVCTEKLNRWIILLLWVLFPPAVWFLVQRDLNTLALKPN